MSQERTFANIALIGMMGSGKSTVGRILAQQLGWTLIDTDAAIVATIGKPVADIFAEDGETAFRLMELAAVRAATLSKEVVIATGGGAVLLEENRNVLWKRCWVVWLTATPEEHYRRVSAGERRPVLERMADPVAAARSILAEREPLYSQADARVDTTGRSVEEVVSDIMEKWTARRS